MGLTNSFLRLDRTVPRAEQSQLAASCPRDTRSTGTQDAGPTVGHRTVHILPLFRWIGNPCRWNLVNNGSPATSSGDDETDSETLYRLGLCEVSKRAKNHEFLLKWTGRRRRCLALLRRSRGFTRRCFEIAITRIGIVAIERKGLVVIEEKFDIGDGDGEA